MLLPVIAAVSFVCLGCGGGGGSTSSASRSLSIKSSTPLVAVGGTAQFELVQQGYVDPELSLEIVEPDGGVLTTPQTLVAINKGILRLYAAPLTPGIYHIRGTAKEDGQTATKTAEIQVVIAG